MGDRGHKIEDGGQRADKRFQVSDFKWREVEGIEIYN
jgi:hypothetical protein